MFQPKLKWATRKFYWNPVEAGQAAEVLAANVRANLSVQNMETNEAPAQNIIGGLHCHL